MPQKNRRRWRGPTVVIVALVGLVSWLQFFWQPIGFYLDRPGAGIGDVVAELLKPTNAIYRDGVGIGYLFLLSLPLVAVAAAALLLQTIRRGLRYIESSEVAISVLETRLTLALDGDDMSRGRVERRQLFHANRRGTSAYHFEHSASAEAGEILSDTAQVRSYIDGAKITNELIKRPSRKRCEVIETFKQELPTSWLATYLPNSWVLWLYRAGWLFKTIVVSRTASIDNLNEYNTREPVFQVTALRYPATHVYLRLTFPEACERHIGQPRCFRIKENNVEVLDLRPDTDGPGRKALEVHVRNLNQESLRIQWENGLAMPRAGGGGAGPAEGDIPTPGTAGLVARRRAKS